ncbi:MAG: hypothetical protein CTY29_12580 [Methylobacter sp.]|nr:MAG: hypothetical protein CTY29_12580 [Methylobacter sp.]
MNSSVYPTIPIKSYRFQYETSHPIHLPDYPGSAWRGALGHALKRTVCVIKNTPCNQCLLKNACAYTYVFETPPPADAKKMRKYTAAPHPFVLRLPENTTKNNFYSLDLLLFGHGQRYFPYLVHALQMAGKEGIGGKRQIFELIKIDELDHQGNRHCIYHDGILQAVQAATFPPIPGMPARIELIFHTPLRIKQDQKNITADNFNFGALFSTLLRRISMISYFHTDTPLDTDFAGLTLQAKQINIAEQQLEWYDWTRYSSRQQTEMNLGGLIGSITLDTNGLEAFWPYLWLGQWTHVGKATSMGLGAYSISATSLPTRHAEPH